MIQEKKPPQPEKTPEPEIQEGHTRGKARDDKLKRIIRQHPQRDEPRAESVESDELPRR